MGTIIRGVIKSRFTFRIGLILLAAAVSGCSSSALLAGLGSGLTSRSGSTDFKFGSLLQVAGGFQHNCYLIQGKVGSATKTRVFCTGKGLLKGGTNSLFHSGYRLGGGLGFNNNVGEIVSAFLSGAIADCTDLSSTEATPIYYCLNTVLKSLPVVDGYNNPIEDVRSISAGKDHTCAVVESVGKVYCWGDNQYGQLGGGQDLQSVPAIDNARLVVKSGGGPSAVPLTGAIQVAAGHTHTCAIVNEFGTNEVYCWGSQNSGETGPKDPTFANNLELKDCPQSTLNSICAINAAKHSGLRTSYYPTDYGNSATVGPGLPASFQVVSVRSGDRFSCASFSDGTLTRIGCWGLDTSYQLGANISLSLSNPGCTGASHQCNCGFNGTVATSPSVHAPAVAVCSGGAGLLVVDAGGSGLSSEGIPPDDSNAGASLLLGYDVGSDHACTVIESNGNRRVKCWGGDVNHQSQRGSALPNGWLGDDVQNTSAVGLSVSGNAGSSEGFSLTSGHMWTCVTGHFGASNDKYYCWGDSANGIGQIAVTQMGNFDNTYAVPVDGWKNFLMEETSGHYQVIGDNLFGQIGGILGSLIANLTSSEWSVP